MRFIGPYRAMRMFGGRRGGKTYFQMGTYAPQQETSMRCLDCGSSRMDRRTFTTGDKVQHKASRGLGMVQRPLRLGETVLPIIRLDGALAGTVTTWAPVSVDKVSGIFQVMQRVAP